jgi:hypothetical protein
MCPHAYLPSCRRSPDHRAKLTPTAEQLKGGIRYPDISAPAHERYVTSSIRRKKKKDEAKKIKGKNRELKCID